MGWIRHHGIVVTSWNDESIEKAHATASGMFTAVTPIVESKINGYRTFLVAPDGSKEGWADSELGDAQRDAFIKWMDAQAYEDGSNSLSWLEYEHDVDGVSARIPRFQGMERDTDQPNAGQRSPADGRPAAEGVARAEVVPQPYGEGRTHSPPRRGFVDATGRFVPEPPAEPPRPTAPPAARHPGYVIGDHWLEAAYARICAGEAEADVLADYGVTRAADNAAAQPDAADNSPAGQEG